MKAVLEHVSKWADLWGKYLLEDLQQAKHQGCLELTNRRALDFFTSFVEQIRTSLTKIQDDQVSKNAKVWATFVLDFFSFLFFFFFLLFFLSSFFPTFLLLHFNR